MEDEGLNVLKKYAEFLYGCYVGVVSGILLLIFETYVGKNVGLLVYLVGPGIFLEREAAVYLDALYEKSFYIAFVSGFVFCFLLFAPIFYKFLKDRS